jgi:uncharacterized repeat protein (TIGR03803 family)
MRSKRVSLAVTAALAIFAAMLFMAATRAAAQTEKVLLDLTYDGGVGGDPQAGLIIDAVGNLYGTTAFGGPHNGGSVFELSPAKGGTWSLKPLHLFLTGVHDGQRPQAGVIFDAAGNLYGTTYWGGTYDVGTVFELMHQPNGSWNENRLYSFSNVGGDGNSPQAGVIFDAAGNLYGTTMIGGSDKVGTVYELTPQADGTWKEEILHSFLNNGTDGFILLAGLVLDHAGNLYGATVQGGPSDVGTIFELTPTAEGPWTEKILYDFNQNGDGNFPYGTLIFDAAGNLYGTTTQGGAYGWGTAFELSPTESGQWVETILYNFNNDGVTGTNPYSKLIFDAKGNLYGTAEGGGINDYGVAFKLTPATGGGWTETVLYNFGSVGDGVYPLGSLAFGRGGNLYGTTDEGGTTGYGTVFEITP